MDKGMWYHRAVNYLNHSWVMGGYDDQGPSRDKFIQHLKNLNKKRIIAN
jgi:hypothetical protein